MPSYIPIYFICLYISFICLYPLNFLYSLFFNFPYVYISLTYLYPLYPYSPYMPISLVSIYSLLLNIHYISMSLNIHYISASLYPYIHIFLISLTTAVRVTVTALIFFIFFTTVQTGTTRCKCAWGGPPCTPRWRRKWGKTIRTCSTLRSRVNISIVIILFNHHIVMIFFVLNLF